MNAHLDPLVDRSPAWLLPGGPDSDVVVASRVRFARNVVGLPFPQRLTAVQADDFRRQVREKLDDLVGDGVWLKPNELSPSEGDFLVERSLATRDLLLAERPTLLLFDPGEALGMLVNEEDHFRAQAFAAGSNLDVALRVARPLVQGLGKKFLLAKHARWGFLTSCPTNVGTGMRASLLLHLPATARSKLQIDQLLKAAKSSFLAVRGVHGEGSRALGQFFQVSNQRTLGTTVEEQIEKVSSFAAEIMSRERANRHALLSEPALSGMLLQDVARAHQRMKEADSLSTAAALDSLSLLRLAALAELDTDFALPDPHLLLQNSFQIQPGHLQARIGVPLEPSQRDSARARLLRSALGLDGSV